MAFVFGPVLQGSERPRFLPLALLRRGLPVVELAELLRELDHGLVVVVSAVAPRREHVLEIRLPHLYHLLGREIRPNLRLYLD